MPKYRQKVAIIGEIIVEADDVIDAYYKATGLSAGEAANLMTGGYVDADYDDEMPEEL